MGAVADKLNQLIVTKEKIKNALISKGVTVSEEDTFAYYADKIGEISGINPNWTSWRYFSYGNNRNDVVAKLKYTDTANGNDFGCMFYSCESLTEIPFIDTSKGTNFSSMFNGCAALTAIPPLNTSQGTNFSNMFDGCQALITLPSLNTENGWAFANMFYSCRSLVTIPALNVSRGTIFSNIFFNCTALENLTLTGTLRESGVDLHYSTQLTKTSIISVVNALAADIAGKSITLSLTAVNRAFETSDGASDGTSAGEWQNLIAAKSNWTILLS